MQSSQLFPRVDKCGNRFSLHGSSITHSGLLKCPNGFEKGF